MNHGTYSLKKLLTDHSLEQIIIPEIQRDYVWTVENVKDLLFSIEKDYNEQKANTKNIDESTLNSMTPEIREIVMRSLSEKKVFSNIGFIYAYSGEGDVSSKYYLIDGQQRITTMYLLLLAISIKNEKQTVFRNTYFNHQITKVDYKVREAAHDFLIEFVEFLLDGGDIKQVVEQCWYYGLCISDKTIQSLIANYKVIQDFVNQSDMDLSFIEDNIELFYFDTSKSEQGEELYIYMNSRGESVQSNENIKAQLLEGLSDKDKHEKGKLWEEWQNFFWRKKDLDSENADDGFNEFLRWIEIIGFITNNQSIIQKAHSDFIKSIKDSSKISKNYIDLPQIEKYYLAVERLSRTDIKYFDKKWLGGATDLIDYVILLPSLLYVARYPEATSFQINRFMRFFVNIIKRDDVNKSPIISAPQSLLLTSEFLNKGLIDIADIGQIKVKGKFDNFLTPEELFKFNQYINQTDNFTRDEIEKAFWKLEDFPITNGKIEFILECLDIHFKTLEDHQFDLGKFQQYAQHFQNLFNNPGDLLRVALLTFGNYSLWDGYSSSLGMHRYNFGSDVENWRVIITHPNTKGTVCKLIAAFSSDNELNVQQYIAKLEMIINDCKVSGLVQDWRKIFIEESESMEFCTMKRACINEIEVVLLHKIRVTNSWTYQRKKYKTEIEELQKE